MLHNVSLIHVNNDAIQEAIANNANPSYITELKANVAFNCVYGFEHHLVPFEDLGNLLSADVGFNMFKFKDYTTAIYNKEKHPDAYGLVRGVNNIISDCSWVCYDVDVTTITDTEMHQILSNLNHHIARTSDKRKATKYRIIIELSTSIHVTRDEWKPFIQSIANQIGIGREVLSQLSGGTIDPIPHLNYAKAEVARISEDNTIYDTDEYDREEALANPYTTFDFAYEAQIGDRWKTSMAAIAKAKRLGASKEYIKDLLYAINDFLDHPKPKHIVESSLFSAI